MLLQQEKCVSFTGITGVGKSSIVNACLSKLSDDYIVPININFSAQTSSLRT
ncbi:hypothetical protein COB52_05565 [Candidatus Kaiserbacteria bacterium]|nr:MAG: hypothetical protein COB52_05565 [Candidatus Kaiserbacteria bacterium]